MTGVTSQSHVHRKKISARTYGGPPEKGAPGQWRGRGGHPLDRAAKTKPPPPDAAPPAVRANRQDLKLKTIIETFLAMKFATRILHY